jgi:hypothetical protein
MRGTLLFVNYKNPALTMDGSFVDKCFKCNSKMQVLKDIVRRGRRSLKKTKADGMA